MSGDADSSLIQRAIVSELGNVHGLLTQFSDVAAEMPGVDPERAAGIAAGAGLVAHRMRRLRAHSKQRPEAAVRVLDPDRRQWQKTTYGQDVLPVATAPGADSGAGLSSGVTRLAAGHLSRVRVDMDSDVVMVVLFGSVVLRWWDALGVLRTVSGLRHQHVHVPRGIPHKVGNPGVVPALLVVVRCGVDLTSGVAALPEFDHPSTCAGLPAADNRD